MNLNLDAWIKFLASKSTFHNLCLTYPENISPNNYEQLNEMLTQKIYQYLSKHSKNQSTNFVESDVLIFKQTEGNLNTKDIESLEEFTRTDAYFLPNKFVLIWGPHKISTIVSNKILKLLEDPPIALSFMFMGFEPNSFLNTIRSRFLNWRLQDSDLPKGFKANNDHQSPDILSTLREVKNSQELEQWSEKFNLSEAQCLDLFWNLSLPDFKQAQEIDRTLAFQQWFDRSLNWKNSAQERWYFLFQLIKNKLQSNTLRN